MPWDQQSKLVIQSLKEPEKYAVIFVAARLTGDVTVQNVQEVGIKTSFAIIDTQRADRQTDGQVEYSSIDIRYNDLEIGRQMEVLDSGAATGDYNIDNLKVAFAQVGIGPRDVLGKVIEEGVSHVGGSLNALNTSIFLDLSEDARQNYNTPCVWKISFRGSQELSFVFDARDGVLLEQYLH